MTHLQRSASSYASARSQACLGATAGPWCKGGQVHAHARGGDDLNASRVHRTSSRSSAHCLSTAPSSRRSHASTNRFASAGSGHSACRRSRENQLPSARSSRDALLGVEGVALAPVEEGVHQVGGGLALVGLHDVVAGVDVVVGEVEGCESARRESSDGLIWGTRTSHDVAVFWEGGDLLLERRVPRRLGLERGRGAHEELGLDGVSGHGVSTRRAEMGEDGAGGGANGHALCYAGNCAKSSEDRGEVCASPDPGHDVGRCRRFRRSGPGLAAHSGAPH